VGTQKSQGLLILLSRHFGLKADRGKYREKSFFALSFQKSSRQITHVVLKNRQKVRVIIIWRDLKLIRFVKEKKHF